MERALIDLVERLSFSFWPRGDTLRAKSFQLHWITTTILRLWHRLETFLEIAVLMRVERDSDSSKLGTCLSPLD